MSKVKVNWNKLLLTEKDGSEHQLSPYEYWYLAPSLTSWNESMGNTSFQRFALLLHNAKIGEGIAPAMTDLLSGISMKTTKTGPGKMAEDILEEMRVALFPQKPSRLRSHFLNYTKEVAIERANAWGWEHRRLERCYLILSSGFYHCADVRIFEQLAADPFNSDLAKSYWLDYMPDNDHSNLEILADSALYFPDWEEFPMLDTKSLIDSQDRLKK